MRRFHAVVCLLLGCACGGSDGSQDTDTGTDTDTGAAMQLGPCARVVDCATVSDRPVTQLLAQYGEDGQCWDEFPTEACWQDCRAFLSDAACAVSQTCCECESASDCAYDPQRPVCLAGSCVAELGGGESEGSGGGPGGGDVEFPATEFLVLLNLVVGPDTPLQLRGTISSQGGALTLDLEYLAVDVGSDSDPRTPVGAFLQVSDVPVTPEGVFEFSVDDVTVPGAANPVSGADIEMSISVAGQVASNQICGALAGMVTAPSNIDLTGSSLSGIPVGDGALPPAADATCD